MKHTWPAPGRLAAAIERLLPRVTKPTRYLGGEVNSRAKDPGSVDLRAALAFPDVYEIGMSHLGFRILYSLLNRIDGVAAERVFMPWTDMLALLREAGLPLCSLETTTPLSEFDLLGFSLQHELNITNVLAMLDLCRIPLYAAERGEDDPLVLVGGPSVFNPEPIAPFCDLVLVGDGEQALPELVALVRKLKAARAPRAEILRAAAGLEGWYAPALYDVEIEPAAGFAIPRPRRGAGAPERVRRRIVLDLDQSPFPEDIVVPHIEIVHDRVSWEIMRGCPVGCRFCQAGYVYRPTRERGAAQVRAAVPRSVDATGYDEFSLTSLNTGRYPEIDVLLGDLMDELAPRRVAAGLSSLHATTLTESLVNQVKRVRKTGFTIAPEAGTQRLRDVINKNLTEDEILRAARCAFEAGWTLIKLYFMIGLPTETDEDVDALADLAGRIASLGKATAGGRAKVTVSVATFTPKVFTPFQWFGMESAGRVAAKQLRIKRRLPGSVTFKGHDHDISWLEGVLSRADRRIAPALVEAYRRGAVFDSWTECFDAGRWRAVFADLGVDAERLATQEIPLDAALPWEVIDPLIRRAWLVAERERALRGEPTPPCAPDACTGCGPFAGHCLERGLAARETALVEQHPGAASPALESAPPAGGETDSTRPPEWRYRARFEKLGRSRFLGHLDLTRALTMALRRAGIRLAYTHGFKPHPKVSLSPALGLGIASLAEYLDFETETPLDAEQALAAVNRSLPQGLALTRLIPVDSRAPALQDVIRRARYRATSPGFAPGLLAGQAAEFLAQTEVVVVRERRGERKELDIRPLVADMAANEDGVLAFTLVLAREGAPKPAEVVAAVAGPAAAETAEITRLELLAESGERFVSPLLPVRARLDE